MLDRALNNNPYKFTAIVSSSIAAVSAVVMTIVTRYTSLAPSVSSNLNTVTETLRTPTEDAILAVSTLVTVMFLAPIIEEILFRKWLWKATSFFMNTFASAIVTTLIFAAAHVDPFHVVGVLPISIFLGILRYKTGSIKLPIIAHVVNNITAVFLVSL